MTRYYRYLDLVMRARVFYRVLGKSVRYVFGIKPIIWPNVAGPTTYEPITTACLVWRGLGGVTKFWKKHENLLTQLGQNYFGQRNH